MVKICLSLLLTAIMYIPAYGGGFVQLADDSRIPLADGWHLAIDSGAYPFQLINAEGTAELLIFRSVIAQGEAIRNEQQLKASVDLVIQDVIMTLPEVKLLSSTGYNDDNRVGFALDFISYDEEREVNVLHRLKAVLYQRPDGDQLLFSLWGKAAVNAEPAAMNEIRFMQEEFAYSGDYELQIFSSATGYDWYLIGFLFALLIVMVFVIKRRQRKGLPAFSGEANFWRCSCGRLNHNDFPKCRRCGRARISEPVI